MRSDACIKWNKMKTVYLAFLWNLYVVGLWWLWVFVKNVGVEFFRISCSSFNIFPSLKYFPKFKGNVAINFTSLAMHVSYLCTIRKTVVTSSNLEFRLFYLPLLLYMNSIKLNQSIYIFMSDLYLLLNSW